MYEGRHEPDQVAQLLTSGGVIGTVVSRNSRSVPPTELQILGPLIDENQRPVSLEQFAEPCFPVQESVEQAPPCGALAVVGSSMNSGKTTTAAGLVKGWTGAGLVVGAAKVTGSGSGKDRWAYLDAGASHVLDFLDFGMPSTFGYPAERLATTMVAMRDGLVREGAEAIVLEIADGVLQPDTWTLVSELPRVCEGVVLAVGDALAARAGADLLRSRGVRVVALSGLVAESPLAAREAAAVTGLPVVSAGQLACGTAVQLLASRTAS
ncbi:DUF1611 domain-containing protein [Allokutzneria albata]|uniref:DUF1611 domain-containing protein n=1 Tax=Allokutzneria albata TaxID=211114 RepID=UPI0012DC2345|nr:DUF1611 domain-containing protein [Allokutzneria albata]